MRSRSSRRRSSRTAASANAARLVGHEQMAAGLEPGEPFAPERRSRPRPVPPPSPRRSSRGFRRPPGSARRRRAPRAKNGAMDGTKPCTAIPSAPSSARTSSGRSLPTTSSRASGSCPRTSGHTSLGEPADALVVRRIAHRAGEQQPRRAGPARARDAAARVSTPVGISSTRVHADRAQLLAPRASTPPRRCGSAAAADDVAAVAPRLGAQRRAPRGAGAGARATRTSAR